MGGCQPDKCMFIRYTLDDDRKTVYKAALIQSNEQDDVAAKSNMNQHRNIAWIRSSLWMQICCGIVSDAAS